MALAALGVAFPTFALPDSDGGVIGWIEDAKGAPVKGVLVSLFGAGLAGGGLVTLSDSAGRFMLPALPAGSYTLRALGSGRATTQQVTILPNRESIFTLSFASAGEQAAMDAALENGPPNDRELKWLMRHKRRSVLEARSSGPSPRAGESIQANNLLGDLVPWLPEIGCAVEVMTSPAAFGVPAEAGGLDVSAPNLGALKLNGRLSDTGRWSLGGLLADSQSTSWRMAAEFVVEPGAGHHLQAGAGYGSRMLQPSFTANAGRLDNRAIGALFVQDRLAVGERVVVSGGARYTYIGFAADRSALSPSLGVEYKAGRHTLLTAQSSVRTLAPGGDLLTLSTLQAAPALAIAVMGEEVRPERLVRHDLLVDRRLGSAATATAFVFREAAQDQLLNQLGSPGGAASLRIVNGPGVVINGAGLKLAGHLGDAMRASVTYTYGRSQPGRGELDSGLSLEQSSLARASSDTSFHDLVGRLEAFVDWSGTRIIAYYRINATGPEAAAPVGGAASLVSHRFDVQLAQDLPFLRAMTRTDWEVLLAFRNMFYEASEAGVLDEIAVLNPPKRVLGGLSVRF